MRFRVFDRHEKKYPEQGKFLMDALGILHIFDYKYNMLKNLKDTDRYVVEFSTGLKDKNEVEIYEGDRIKSNCFAVNCTVIFQGGGFTLAEGETSYNLESNFIDSDGYKINDIKIIGTIHDKD